VEGSEEVFGLENDGSWSEENWENFGLWSLMGNWSVGSGSFSDRLIRIVRNWRLERGFKTDLKLQQNFHISYKQSHKNHVSKTEMLKLLLPWVILIKIDWNSLLQIYCSTDLVIEIFDSILHETWCISRCITCWFTWSPISSQISPPNFALLSSDQKSLTLSRYLFLTSKIFPRNLQVSHVPRLVSTAAFN
jgi:hypothetical protein